MFEFISENFKINPVKFDNQKIYNGEAKAAITYELIPRDTFVDINITDYELFDLRLNSNKEPIEEFDITYSEYKVIRDTFDPNKFFEKIYEAHCIPLNKRMRY